MAEFSCCRCGVALIRPLEECDKDPESYGYLKRLEPPQGWEDINYLGLFCTACVKDLADFMRAKKP
jgi:hypothetical protein